MLRNAVGYPSSARLEGTISNLCPFFPFIVSSRNKKPNPVRIPFPLVEARILMMGLMLVRVCVLFHLGTRKLTQFAFLSHYPGTVLNSILLYDTDTHVGTPHIRVRMYNLMDWISQRMLLA